MLSLLPLFPRSVCHEEIGPDAMILVGFFFFPILTPIFFFLRLMVKGKGKGKGQSSISPSQVCIQCGQKIISETQTFFKHLNCQGPKITVNGNCSLEIKRCLLLGRKAVTNLESILKSRDISLLTKVHLVKAMFFSVVLYGCESWTIKKVEH